MAFDINEQLDSLSQEERELVTSILKEYSENGESQKYNNLIYDDYKEIPVDIHTFLHEKQYLGEALYDAEGRFTLYEYWEETLGKIFPNNIDTDYHTAIFTGAIGIGKSTVAVIGMIYQLYRILCLKNPQLHYQLQNNDVINFVFVNTTKKMAQGVAWEKFNNIVLQSKWFLERGTIRNTDPVTWKPNSTAVELFFASRPGMLQGKCCFSIFCDEVNFSAVATDINKKKKAMKALVSEASNRLQSRFQRGTKNPTVLWLASSKASDQSFLDEFIQNKLKNEKETTLIVDKPQWIIKKQMDVPEKFPVAVGNKYMENILLPQDATEEIVQSYVNRGYKILRVPAIYWGKFAEDLNKALCDIAGLSVAQSTSFISGQRVLGCVDFALQNPFISDVIEVGNDVDDTAQYSDFFDFSQLPKSLLHRPLYIHLDLSISGDKTGIAGVWIKDKKPSPEGQPQGRDLRFQLAFSVSVQAPKGRQISFEKTRNFIRWLKSQGLNIKEITADTYNSASTLQALASEGFKTSILSVDRVKDNTCEPYEFLKQAINEQRVIMYDTKLLKEELVGLKKDNTTGKIDHSPEGINSKDQADALCGATYSASKHAEEFAIDYGETWEVAIDVSAERETSFKEREQNFLYEHEITKMSKKETIDEVIQQDYFMDFGMGKAQPIFTNDDYLIMERIVLF